MVSAPPPPPPPPNKGYSFDAGHVPMTEELDSARWTLPPVVPVLVAFLLVGVVVTALLWRTQPQVSVSGNIERVSAAMPKAENVVTFAVVRLKVSNQHPDKPLYIKSIKADIKTPQGEFSDEASPASDHSRYFQALPELAGDQVAAVKIDERIPAGGEHGGMIMVAFPITKEVFDQRQQLTVTLTLYDRAPLVLNEKK